MDKKTKALKLALEALESCSAGDYSTGHVIHPSFDVDAVNRAIDAVDEALAEQPAQQEPVAWHGYDLDGMVEAFDRVIQAHYNSKQPFHSPVDSDARMALRILCGFIPSMKRYTSPQPNKPWVGLTEDELNMIGDSMRTWNSYSLTDVYVAIEAKLKEKNT